MKNGLMMSAVMGVSMFGNGCAMLSGDGDGSHKVWTYNLKQSLARSGGDIAMTMTLDQGVDKKDVVGLVEAVVVFLEGNEATKAQFDVKLAELGKGNVKYEKIIKKIQALVPNAVKASDKIPVEVKTILLSFLRDGAIYGATMYKDASKDKSVEVDENLTPKVE